MEKIEKPDEFFDIDQCILVSKVKEQKVFSFQKLCPRCGSEVEFILRRKNNGIKCKNCKYFEAYG